MEVDDRNELFHRIALSFVPGIGARRQKMLLDHFGTASGIFGAPLKALCQFDGITEVNSKGFRDKSILSRAEKETSFVEKNNVRVLYHGHPNRLANCTDAPQLLFFKGVADMDAKKVIAIVGTRKNTDYGQQACEDLVEALSGLDDVLVVSGLALGIDAIAHKKSVAMGIPTIGVLGHGLDRIYPFTHKTLALQMQEHGGLLTEFPSETEPDRNNFPMRNRIVAGMADITVVVESNISGGALITALMANGYNREVAAYPGRITDSRSAGCNEIIRTQVATMITKPDDVLELMQWGKTKKSRAVQSQLFLELSPEEQSVADLLSKVDAMHADELMLHSGISYSILASTLLQLEMSGLVKSLPGKIYRLT